MTRQSAEYPLDYTKGKETATDYVRDMADRTRDQLKETAEGAQEMVGKVAEQAREYGEKALEAAKEFKPFVEKSMKEQPMATLAGAAVIGFLLGALWKK